jgi:phenylpyruvate tautomerase PptA (4-oxalocrotonate tautomerase family)
MPMLDAFVPDGALSADAERELLSRLTDILLRNEGADPTPEGQYDDKRRQAMVEQVTEAVLDLPPGSASSEDAQADSVAVERPPPG